MGVGDGCHKVFVTVLINTSLSILDVLIILYCDVYILRGTRNLNFLFIRYRLFDEKRKK